MASGCDDSKKIEILKREILKLSRNKHNFQVARKEWELVDSYDEAGGTCLCSHHPITERCVIKNRKTHNTATVGNVCVGKFLGGTQRLAAESLIKIKNDLIKGRANEQLIELMYKKEVLNEKDRDAYMDLWRKRKPTKRQKHYIVKMNCLILQHVDQNRPNCVCNGGSQPAILKRSTTRRNPNRLFYTCRRNGCRFFQWK